MKSKSAITLVALIITIIILLILATVSISLVINNNVLDKAQHGVDRYSEEEELEQIKLAVASAMLKGNGFLDTENLNNELQDRFGKDAIQIGGLKSWSLKLDKSYRIYEDGNVEEKESILPAEYQQVEYIESTGTQYIDTKVNQSNYRNDLKGYLEFQFTNINNIQCVGGCRNSANNNYFFIILTNSNNFQSNLGNGTSLEINLSNLDLNKHNFLFDSKLGICNFDGSMFNYKNTNANAPYNIYLFAYNDADSGALRGSSFKNYTFSLRTSQDVLIRNFIPCYSTTTVTDVDGIEKSAGTIGMYDTIEGKFYTNKGTGTFGYGMEDGTYVAPTNN